MGKGRRKSYEVVVLRLELHIGDRHLQNECVGRSRDRWRHRQPSYRWQPAAATSPRPHRVSTGSALTEPSTTAARIGAPKQGSSVLATTSIPPAVGIGAPRSAAAPWPRAAPLQHPSSALAAPSQRYRSSAVMISPSSSPSPPSASPPATSPSRAHRSRQPSRGGLPDYHEQPELQQPLDSI